MGVSLRDLALVLGGIVVAVILMVITEAQNPTPDPTCRDGYILVSGFVRSGSVGGPFCVQAYKP